LNGITFGKGITRLALKINNPSITLSEPEAHAGILHVKNLPHHINNNKSLYELFRPFGPMILCKILVVEQQQIFKGTALVQYFNSQHAKDAETTMVKTCFVLCIYIYIHIYLTSFIY
jgi:RNA recognition motif-containing protein